MWQRGAPGEEEGPHARKGSRELGVHRLRLRRGFKRERQEWAMECSPPCCLRAISSQIALTRSTKRDCLRSARTTRPRDQGTPPQSGCCKYAYDPNPKNNICDNARNGFKCKFVAWAHDKHLRCAIGQTLNAFSANLCFRLEPR